MRFKKAAIISIAAVSIMTAFSGCSDKDSGSSGNSGKNDPTSVQSSGEVSAFDIKSATSNIKFYGKDISLPCVLSDLGEGLTLENPLPFKDNSLSYTLKRNGEVIGGVGLENIKFGEDTKDKQIMYLKLLDTSDVAENFSVKGITLKATEEEAIAVFGQPTRREKTQSENNIIWQLDDNNYFTITDITAADNKRQITISTSI
ncbi:MAG: hypothetical protein LBL93_02645 [Ruminococcus sp.]|jgi:hypothetical protein|nr:hypothetical protein [Ruminococcus sp.]